MAEKSNPKATIKTSLGDIQVELFADKAPLTVDNFIDLINQNFYDGIIFHRVIKDFMVQVGCPLGRGTGGRAEKGLAERPLKDEFHPDLKHDRPGILSMANAGPHTGDTQIFITTVPTSWLDGKHAVFGVVVNGMDVLKKIEGLPTDPRDRPKDPPKIVSVTLDAA